MPYQLKPGYLYAPFRRNDNPSSKVYEGSIYTGWRDGFGGGYIDPLEWSSPVVLSDDSLRRVSWIRLPLSWKPTIQSLSTLENALDANSRILPTKLAIDPTTLSMKLIDGRSEDFLSASRGHKLTLPFDGSKLSPIILRDLSKQVFLTDAPLTDLMAVSTGTYLVGSGPGDNYPLFGTAAGAYADMANLTGDLSFYLNSSITDTGTAVTTINLNNYTLTTGNNSPPAGDPTIGYKITQNHNGHYMYYQIEGPGLGVTKDIHIEVSAPQTTTYASILWTSVVTSYIHEVLKCMVNRSANRGFGIVCGDSDVILNMRDCIAWDGYTIAQEANSSLLGSTAINAASVWENCCAYKSASYGIRVLAAMKIRNCVSIGNNTDYYQTSLATGRYNIDSDGSAANGNWATGVGNKSYATTQVWKSIDDTSPNFLDVW